MSVSYREAHAASIETASTERLNCRLSSEVHGSDPPRSIHWGGGGLTLVQGIDVSPLFRGSLVNTSAYPPHPAYIWELWLAKRAVVHMVVMV